MHQGRIIFMLEEPSMAEFLEYLLPRIFPNWLVDQHFLCIAHEGKSDLEQSLSRKLKAWTIKKDRFVVIRDNDNGDCTVIKAKLRSLCRQAGRPETLIRIACQELEAWYLGDLPALCKAFDVRVDTQPNRKRFQAPDRLSQPSKDVKKLAPSFQKRSGARAMAQQIDVANNVSESFNQFISGLHCYLEPKL